MLRKLVTEFGHYDSIQTVDQVSAYEYKLECVREWSKTIQDGCIRNGYADWLEFYAGRAREARADILANKRQSERDDYERKRREEERLLRAYEAKHSVPSPPLCERSLIERVK